jgi:hypothetical protein
VAYKAIKDKVDIEIFPFGKSQSFVDKNGKTQFKCQHGPEECRKNMFQTCGLHLIGSNKDAQGMMKESSNEISKIYCIFSGIHNLHYGIQQSFHSMSFCG